MDGLVLQRAFRASVREPVVIGVAILLSSFVFIGVVDMFSLAGAFLALAPAQLLKAGAALRRSRRFQLSLWYVSKVGGSILLTWIATGLGAAAFDTEPEPAFGFLVGLVATFFGKSELHWPCVPREEGHRRFKARIFALVFGAVQRSFLCLLAANALGGTVFMFTDSSSSLGAFAVAGFWGAVVLLLAELHCDNLETCSQVSARIVDLRDLKEALELPLAREPLGRWVALATLAQAVAHRQGPRFGSLDSTAERPQLQLAAEIFGSCQSQGQARPCLFPSYLQSGLEVIREATIRALCLTGLAARGGPSARALRIPELDLALVEFAPLARLAAAGLTGWACLSRSLDTLGTVQRCNTLASLIRELFGLLSALNDVLAIRGSLPLSSSCASICMETWMEVKHSLIQLFLSFEGQDLVLPPSYKRLIVGLCP
jgi:hypothetical protein